MLTALRGRSYSLESGPAMLSSERISASIPNPASATAAASISNAAKIYPPASAQGEPVFDEMAEQHGRQSTADCRADGVEDGERERARLQAEAPRWRSDRRSSQPPTRRKRSASTQMFASRR